MANTDMRLDGPLAREIFDVTQTIGRIIDRRPEQAKRIALHVIGQAVGIALASGVTHREIESLVVHLLGALENIQCVIAPGGGN